MRRLIVKNRYLREKEPPSMAGEVMNNIFFPLSDTSLEIIA
jgi:hypothetical protein